MSNDPIKLLMIEDTTVEARTVKQLLARSKQGHFEIEWVSSLTAGLKQLASNENEFDIVLTDLQLPDGYGLGTFRLVQEHALDLPIVLLTNIEEAHMGVKAIAAGAQDYLIKSQIDSARLIRALLFAIERHRLVSELRNRYEARIADLEGNTD